MKTVEHDNAARTAFAERLRRGRERLAGCGIDSAEGEVRRIAAYIWGRDYLSLLTDPPRADAAKEKNFDETVRRRAGREPLQRLIGRTEFFSYEFTVKAGVFVPRPETERLVELALEFLSAGSPARILEIGCGSGAIGLSLAAARPRVRVWACDICPAALGATRENAQNLGVEDRVEVFYSDLFSSVDGKFDLLVSNPPYVPRAEYEGLDPEVKFFDPVAALVSGEDGLFHARKILEGAPAHLNPGARVLIETGGAHHVDALRRMAEKSGVYENIRGQADLNGIERFLTALYRG